MENFTLSGDFLPVVIANLFLLADTVVTGIFSGQTDTSSCFAILMEGEKDTQYSTVYTLGLPHSFAPSELGRNY